MVLTHKRKCWWMLIDYFVLISLWIPFTCAKNFFEIEIETPSLWRSPSKKEGLPKTIAKKTTKKTELIATSQNDKPHENARNNRWDQWVEDTAKTDYVDNYSDHTNDDESALAASHPFATSTELPDFPSDYEYFDEEDLLDPESFEKKISSLFTAMETTESNEDFLTDSTGLRMPHRLEDDGYSHSNRSPMPRQNNIFAEDIFYRYYGRKRFRMRNRDGIPFICLGPSVDHWKAPAQLLASRGFSVMTCELPSPESEDGNNKAQVGKYDRDPEDKGPTLILDILDAFRWQRAILVGCDEETILILRAALRLAPERVAGVVFCGDLSSLETMSRGDSVDNFLQKNLDCPFQIIWDGDENTSGRPHRTLILGGGSNPHIKKPEQFAWSLTRFVEETVVPLAPTREVFGDTPKQPNTIPSIFKWFPELKEFINPISTMFAGDIIAAVILCVVCFKTVSYQYLNLHKRAVKIQNAHAIVSSWPKKLLHLILRAPMFLLVGRTTAATENDALSGLDTCELESGNTTTVDVVAVDATTSEDYIEDSVSSNKSNDVGAEDVIIEREPIVIKNNTVEENTEPVENEENIVEEHTEPVENEENIVEENAEPVDNEESILNEDTEPADNEESILNKNTEPVGNEESILDENMEPVGNEENILGEITEPIDNEGNILDENMEPVDHEESILNVNKEPVDNEENILVALDTHTEINGTVSIVDEPKEECDSAIDVEETIPVDEKVKKEKIEETTKGATRNTFYEIFGEIVEKPTKSYDRCSSFLNRRYALASSFSKKLFQLITKVLQSVLERRINPTANDDDVLHSGTCELKADNVTTSKEYSKDGTSSSEFLVDSGKARAVDSNLNGEFVEDEVNEAEESREYVVAGEDNMDGEKKVEARGIESSADAPTEGADSSGDAKEGISDDGEVSEKSIETEKESYHYSPFQGEI